MMKDFIDFQKRRMNRIRKMDAVQVAEKLRQKLEYYFSLKSIIRRFAFNLEKYSVSKFASVYKEASESGAINIELKQQRVNLGGRFEPLDVELVNRGALALIGDAKKILEVGCGTGMFASFAALDKSRHITASEFDHGALEWARNNRCKENVDFCTLKLNAVETDAYDLVVSIEVIEHLSDYGGFLSRLSLVAPRAIISTPNRDRSAFDSVAPTPFYSDHVREWTAGELYWVLKMFYENVELYTIEDTKGSMKKIASSLSDEPFYIPPLQRCSLWTKDPHLIADCSSPRRTLSFNE